MIRSAVAAGEGAAAMEAPASEALKAAAAVEAPAAAEALITPAAKAVGGWSAAGLEAVCRWGVKAMKAAAVLSAVESRPAATLQSRVTGEAAIQTGAGRSAGGSKMTPGRSFGAPQTRGRRRAARAKAAARSAGMLNANAVGTMPANVIAAAPAVPAIRAAPAVAIVQLITAPIPAGTMPAVVIPTVVFVIEGKVLGLFDRRRALAPINRLADPIADASVGAAATRGKTTANNSTRKTFFPSACII